MPKINVGQMVGFVVGQALLAFVRLSTGVHLRESGLPPGLTQRVYFSNHTSIGDFILIWAVMSPELRRTTRTVAAEDYWTSSALRRFLALNVFNALLISRCGQGGAQRMTEALRRGESLIIFPEGTRNTSAAWLTPFKSGLYHLACEHPQVQFIPVWIDNLRNVMPKGAWLPLPLVCSVGMGAPLPLRPSEPTLAFLERAQEAVLALKPDSQAAVPC
ncbi:lysophospholipid acyltransferase family protein [Aquabacterium sp.]|uniref:lysophospholipid acyltransferase family protein n=1 Tax=Aquabacterium sp. TaxID=1872578 RepID=UPI003D6CEE22